MSDDAPIFRAGLAASRAEFRSTDVRGRPVDASAELPTQRAERIRDLQDQRMAMGPREAPSAEPGAVLREWLAASPDNRMSAFAEYIAGGSVLICEIEPGPGERPVPGGLYEQVVRRTARPYA